MADTKLIILLSFMLLKLLGNITAAPIKYNCTYLLLPSHNATSTTYLGNLKQLLFSLSSNATTTGFYNSDIGDGSDKVYGQYLCRGDLTNQACQACIATAVEEIQQVCTNKTSALVWYDNCMMRYSNKSFFLKMQEQPYLYYPGPSNITHLEKYNTTVRDLMLGIASTAAYYSTLKYYATGEANTGSDPVYGLVQCTPDISPEDCYNCLKGSVLIDIPKLLYPKQGGRILKPSCNMRYEFNSHFYEEASSSPPATATSPSPSPPPGKRRNWTTIIILVILSVGIFVTIIIISICVRRKKQKLNAEDEVNQSETTSFDSLQFNLDIIRAVTDNFSDANKLGQGGFGAVYKGKLLNEQLVAVKRLSKNSGQGEIEFKNEVMLVAKLQHKNLVRILGFCLEGEERLLIYEFVPNKSLDHFIFDPIERPQLDWEKRYKIIEGIARGILYLHEDSRLKIIHRDLKASNILLDEEMNPKIADFGMARLFEFDQSHANTNRVVGTYGYMAPEYIMHGQFSVKTDVFSFGVLLLEIVTGQRNNNLNQTESIEGGLLNYAWRKWNEGTASTLIDPTMRENYDMSEAIRCIHIGLLCVQENVSNRPSMASVVIMLNSYSASLPLPTSAAFVMNSQIEFAEFSMDDSSQSETKSINKVSITDLSGR